MPNLHASRYRRGVHERHAKLATARLYLCTDARRERGDLAEFADAALSGGVDIIQLRDKGSSGEQRFGPLEARGELAALEILADAARRHGALLAVNDRADIARAAGADILHLGQDDLPLDGGPRHRRPRHPDRALDPRDGRGRACADGGRRLLLRGSLLADARPSRAGPPPGWIWCGRSPVCIATSRGSPSAASTSSACPRSSTAGARRIVVVRAITAAADPAAAAGRLSSALALAA